MSKKTCFRTMAQRQEDPLRRLYYTTLKWFSTSEWNSFEDAVGRMSRMAPSDLVEVIIQCKEQIETDNGIWVVVERMYGKYPQTVGEAVYYSRTEAEAEAGKRADRFKGYGFGIFYSVVTLARFFELYKEVAIHHKPPTP